MNHLKFVKNFFASVFQVGGSSLNLEVIYVDNCSTDGSVDFIRQNYPQVKVVCNETNFGFGANNNRGAKLATGKYVAILNPDIVLLPGSLDALYEYAETHSGWGVLAPNLLNGDGSFQYSVRTFATAKMMISRIFTLGRDSSENSRVNQYLNKDMDCSKAQPVDWAIGAALFLNNDFFKKLKGFDEDYFLYMEDEDLCLRSWKEGLDVVYVPQSQMKHIHLRSSSHIGRMTFIHFFSLLIFFRKHGLNVRRPSSLVKV